MDQGYFAATMLAVIAIFILMIWAGKKIGKYGYIFYRYLTGKKSKLLNKTKYDETKYEKSYFS